jgi:TetR/AcrR family transcriptional repressor of nem operon
MGRPRSIDEQQVIASAANLFIEIGFEATSVDDLVETVALHRGSLYKAFGSKRGIFIAALRRLVELDLPAAPADPDALVAGRTLDLLLVAALELAPRDDEVRQLVETACRLLAERLPGSAPHGSAGLLGRRLLERAIHPEPVVPKPRGGPSDGTREHGRRLDDGRDAGAAQGLGAEEQDRGAAGTRQRRYRGPGHDA